MMKKIKIALLSVLAMVGMGVIMAGSAYATGNDCTTLLTFVNCDDANGGGIMQVIQLVISIMAIGVAVLATAGIVWCGALIMTARDDPAQVAKARKRIVEIIIGLVAWELMSLLIAFLIPNGSNINIGLVLQEVIKTEVIHLI